MVIYEGMDGEWESEAGGVDGLSVQKLIYEAVYISWALWENIVSFDWDRHFTSVFLPLLPSQILLHIWCLIPSLPLPIFSPNLVLSFIVFSYLFFLFIHLTFSSSLCLFLSSFLSMKRLLLKVLLYMRSARLIYKICSAYTK